MKKSVLVFLELLGAAFGLQAEVSYMTIELTSGEQYSFLLKDKPEITYKNGELIVNGDDATSYAISSVKDYHFTEKDLTTGVQESSVAHLRFVSVDESTIQVENATAKAIVTLVGMNGVVWSTTQVDEAGVAIVNLPNYSGAYLLTVDQQSFKIIRK